MQCDNFKKRTIMKKLILKAFALTVLAGGVAGCGNSFLETDYYNGIEKETGSLKEGLAGDLLVVKGDVSKNIRALDDVLEVYLAGKTVYTV
jgi:hypothetical protein